MVMRPGLNESDLRALQTNLERMGAACGVHIKRRPRGRWVRVAGPIPVFETGLASALELRPTAHEVGIFLDHDGYGGIMIWTSLDPDVINTFEAYYGAEETFDANSGEPERGTAR